MGEQNYVFVEKRHGGYILRLNNPPHNVLHFQLITELKAAFNGAIQDSSCKKVVIAGANKCFSTGIAAPELCDLALHEAVFSLCKDIEKAKIPVFAVLDGPAYNAGLEIALAARWIFARPDIDIRFGISHFGAMPTAGSIQRLSRRVAPADTYDFCTKAQTQIVGSADWHSTILSVHDDPLAVALGKDMPSRAIGDKYSPRQGPQITAYISEIENLKSLRHLDEILHENIINALEFSNLLPFEAGVYAEQSLALSLMGKNLVKGRIALRRAELANFAAARDFQPKSDFTVAFRGHGPIRTELEKLSQSNHIHVLSPDEELTEADLIFLCTDANIPLHAPAEVPVVQFAPSIESAWNVLAEEEKHRATVAEWVINGENTTPAALCLMHGALEQKHQTTLTAFFQQIKVVPMRVTEKALDISAILLGAMMSGYSYWLERGITLQRLDSICADVGFQHPFSNVLKALGPVSAQQVQRDYGETPSGIFQDLLQHDLNFNDLMDTIPQGILTKPQSPSPQDSTILAHILAPIFMAANRYLSNGGIARLCEFDVLMVNILGMSRGGGGLSYLCSEIGMARLRKVILERANAVGMPWHVPPILDELLRENMDFMDIFQKPWPKVAPKRLEKSPPRLQLSPKLKALETQD